MSVPLPPMIFSTFEILSPAASAAGGGDLRAVRPHRQCDSNCGAGIADGVIIGAAIQLIGTSPADQNVVARAAIEGIVAGRAVQRVVAIVAAQDVDAGMPDQRCRCPIHL